MVVSCLMLAHQVAGKAARDALFLSQFNVSYFPMIVIAGSAVSIAGGLVNSRLLQAFTPARMVPWGFLFSGALHFAEWGFRNSPYRNAMVIGVYVHVVGLGAIVLSSFWSLLNERFDPHSGKKFFGRIAGVGTLGGVLGGIAAERFAVWLPLTSVLLFLGALHLTCSAFSFLIVRRSRFLVPDKTAKGDDENVTSIALPVFRKSSYLQMLAGIVVLGTTTAALLDIVFKTQAATIIGKGPHLFRFFAIFYTVGQILSFVVQVLVTRRWLEKLGLARGVASLSTAVATGGIGALVFPIFPVLVVARALEIVLRGSIYRAGYELLYTPLPVNDKRTAKPVIDVVFDRLGDGVGGATAQLLLSLGGTIAIHGILFITIGLAGVTFYITRRLEKAYVRVLETGLVERAVELDVSVSNELITRSVLLKTLLIKRETTTPAQVTVPTAPQPPIPHPQISDPLLQQLADLRSGNPLRVRQTLAGIKQLDSLLAPQVIVLLAWDEVSPDALQILRKDVKQIAGQLVDSMLDKNTDFAIRRRIPRILAYSDDLRAVQGLMGGLGDTNFEVRFHSARALDAILQKHPEYRPAPDAVFAIIDHELSVDRGVWENRRLLDRRQSNDQFLFLDETLRERALLSWEHLFTLLALILPREPLKVAFQALHTDDRILRGLALEYLDSVLPHSLRRVPGILESVASTAPFGEKPKDVVSRLMEARQSVTLKLAKVPAPETPTGT